MGTFLQAAFAALPKAAQDTRALIAYAIACLAWVVVSLKVKRNHNLLKSLDKLPESGRLEALRMEMGAVTLREGVSPEQFLRARIHTYYFWAFMTLCLVFVLVITLAVFQRTPQERSLTNAFQHALSNEQDEQDAKAETARIHGFESKLANLAFHQTPDYLVGQFEEPSFKNRTKHYKRYIWKNPLFWLIVEFDKGGLTDYIIEIRDKRLTVKVPRTGEKLGNEPFGALQGEAIYYNLGNGTGLQYAKEDGGFIPHEEVSQFEYYGYSDWESVNTPDDAPEVGTAFDSHLLFEEIQSGKPGKQVQLFETNLYPNAVALHRTAISKERSCSPDRSEPVFDTDGPRIAEEAEKCNWLSLWYVDQMDRFADTN